MRYSIFAIVAAVGLSAFSLISSPAQTPAPIIIQAATPAPAVAQPSPKALAGDDSNAVFQLLLEMQANNAATIKKQEAALVTLDALQQSAEQIKIFSKRS